MDVDGLPWTLSQGLSVREYTASDDLNRRLLGRRNAAVLLARGIEPVDVVRIVDPVAELCPNCARPRHDGRKTCGRPECRSCPPGCRCDRHRRRTVEERARIGAGERRTWESGRRKNAVGRSCTPGCDCGRHHPRRRPR